MIKANPGNKKTIQDAQNLLYGGDPVRAALLCKRRLTTPGANKDMELLSLYATALSTMGNHAEARQILKKAVRDFPRSSEMQCRLGITYYHEHRFKEAIEYFRKALAIDPQDHWASRCLADSFIAMSDLDAALELLEPQVVPGAEFRTDVALPLCQVYLKRKRFQESLDLIDRALAGAALVPVIERNFVFYRGDALRGLGRYDESFTAYERANKSAGVVFDAAQHTREVEMTIEAWSGEKIESMPRSNRKSGHLVFIVGMYRSGTSLCEQIIASHPRAFGAGELRHIVDIVKQFNKGGRGARAVSRALWDLEPLTAKNIDNAAEYFHKLVTPLAPGSDVITDKMPSDFLALGLIGQMFPDCRVIHCLRDPRDSLLSNYFNQFTMGEIPFAYDLDHLGSYFADYWKIMAHWKSVLKIPILDVQYESLVADPEAQSRRLIEFTGLDWDDRCLDFHKTKRTTKTLSSDQVNKPIYRESLARWKPYEKHFEPMMKWLPPEALWSGPE